MYAIIEISGRQWKVEPGTTLDVNRLATPVGSQHTITQVLFAHDGEQAHIGKPYIDSAQVIAEVVENRQGPKEISYHFRRRENWRKTVGHRQPLSRLIIRTIVCGGKTAGEAFAKQAEPKVKEKAPRAAHAKAQPAPEPQKVSAVKRRVKSLAGSTRIAKKAKEKTD